ncbi:MAG: hypothetical protein K1X47_16200 [Cyclobacteriaceae bacterium]|nr:hypothetical protein [Cyclobacteriaceae bacterium]
MISRLLSLLALLTGVYFKVTTNDPDLWLELSLDVLIVVSALGIVDLALRSTLGFLYGKICALRERFFKYNETHLIMKQLLTGLLMLAAGLISPSNGVDEGIVRDPVAMLLETLLVVAVAVLVYMTWAWIRTSRLPRSERRHDLYPSTR